MTLQTQTRIAVAAPSRAAERLQDVMSSSLVVASLINIGYLLAVLWA